AAAAAPGAAAGQVLTDEDFETIEVEKAGDLPVNVSYPDLAPLPAALELELTTRMKRFLRVDEVWSADMVGAHDGDCVVGLVAPEVVSIACRHLIDARTKAQAAAGTIGAPGDYTRAAFTYWRETGLPSIDPAELVGADRLKRLCGDAARPMVVLDGDGLRWVPDDNHVAPAGCPDGVEWSDMEPASPRARALLVRVSPAARTPPP
ncbi:MAG: hypothetical protein K8M05_03525, partial [Deltaproteobacteria bacterium]|nr:hypothetical protein [Kofleriaceae bacterium]